MITAENTLLIEDMEMHLSTVRVIILGRKSTAMVLILIILKLVMTVFIIKGSCFSIEPGIYLPEEKLGFRTKLMFLLTKVE